MKPSEIGDVKKIAAVLEAFKAGKARYAGSPIRDLNIDMLLAYPDNYSITHELTPWTGPDDVPFGAEFRRKGNLNRVSMGFCDTRGIFLADDYFSYSDMLLNFEHTLDGKEWRPCGKEGK